MTSKERKLRKALKLYGVTEEETIDSFIKDLDAMPDEENVEPAAAEQPNVESVGETPEANGKSVENVEEKPKPDESSETVEDGEIAEEVNPSEESSGEEKGDEVAKEVDGGKPMEEVAEEQPTEPEATEPPVENPPATNYDEAFKLIQSKNEELERANAGYDARLAKLEEIIASLGQPVLVPDAQGFGNEQRESPAGKDYTDVRSDLINKLGGRSK